MKLLVTGASGFIGHALSERLIKEGMQLRVLVRDPRQLKGLAAEVMQGDLTDPAAIEDAVAGMDIVFNVAGSFRNPAGTDEDYRRINVDAVGHIIRAARRHGVRRVVHTSTVGIHGSIESGAANEDSPILPEGTYEETKAAGDALALDEARQGRPEVVVLRPSPVYGPGDMRLLKFFRLAGQSRPILLGDGHACYHMVHIDDLVDAFMLAAQRPEAAGEAFIIAGAEKPSLNELVGLVAGTLGRPVREPIHLPAKPIRALAHACEIVCRPFKISPPLYRRRVDFFTNERRYDIGKATRLLGYVPKVPLKRGLADTAAWYRLQGLLLAAVICQAGLF